MRIAYLLLGTLVACTDTQEIADKAATAATAKLRTDIQSAVANAISTQVADLSRACSNTVSGLARVAVEACIRKNCTQPDGPFVSRYDCIRCCLGVGDSTDCISFSD